MHRIKEFFIIFLIFPQLNINAEPLSLEILEVKILDTYEATKQLPGKLFPVQQSNVAFQIGGKIQSIPVDIGDEVKEGDILAELDNNPVLKIMLNFQYLLWNFLLLYLQKIMNFKGQIT